MKLKQEESSTVNSRPLCCAAVVPPKASANEINRGDKTETLVERLALRVTNMDVDDEKLERHREDVKSRSGESCRRKTKENALQIRHRKCSLLDMRTSRSRRHSLCVSFILWTSVLLLFLTKECTGEDRSRFDRYPKYDHDTEVQGYVSPEVQNKYQVIHILRDIIQRQQQQQQERANQQQLQMNNNGDDLSENQNDWKNMPLPLLYHIRAIINDSSKEEDKRGSYMSLCHFKICNLG